MCVNVCLEWTGVPTSHSVPSVPGIGSGSTLIRTNQDRVLAEDD